MATKVSVATSSATNMEHRCPRELPRGLYNNGIRWRSVQRVPRAQRMSRKSENRFSEKDMRQARYLAHGWLRIGDDPIAGDMQADVGARIGGGRRLHPYG